MVGGQASPGGDGMTKVLVGERVLTLNIELAEKIGLNEAIVLNQLYFLSDMAGRGILDKELYKVEGDFIFLGLSIPEWQELYYPFWSPATVKRAFNSIYEYGFICKEKLSDDRTDRKNWYAVDFMSDAWGQNDLMLNRIFKIKEEEEKTFTLVGEWERLAGPITPVIADDLYALQQDWDAHTSGLEENHSDKGRPGAEVVIEAVKEMLRYADRPSINYTRAIIDGWIKNGYKVDTRQKKNGRTPKKQEAKATTRGSVYG